MSTASKTSNLMRYIGTRAAQTGEQSEDTVPRATHTKRGTKQRVGGLVLINYVSH